MTEETLELPEKLYPLFYPERGEVQYRSAYGGRGSGKSMNFASVAAFWGYMEPLRILCVRDLQSSIRESFHAELRMAIHARPWLAQHYDVGVDYLRGANGTEFLFRGLRRNIGSIQSLAQVDLTIVEEAEDVPESSWVALEPTVLRTPKSEIWTIWNPKLDGSPVDQRFRKNPPENAVIAEVNYFDNPWFPPGLETLRKRDQGRLDPATYAHIWEGAYLENSNAQVLAGKVRVSDFKPSSDWDGPYFGADWGFAQDPTAGVKCWIHGDCLYIEYEAGEIGLEIDKTANFLKAGLPGVESHVLRADSARPETISYVRRHGLPNCVGVDKWSGSVEDGIAHLRSYREIVIHPRCRETIRESRLYSYKVDRLSGDVLPVIVDAYNHYWDAVRYALSPLIRSRTANSVGYQVPGL